MTTPDTDNFAALRQSLGSTGIWAPPPERFGTGSRELAAAVEKQGFGSLWIGGSYLAPDVFTQVVSLLDGSERLIIGTGIASIWGREPSDMRQGADTLVKGFPGRFILGLGVSHAPAVEKLGRTYDRPYSAMARYLAEMDHPAGYPAEPLGEPPTGSHRPGHRVTRRVAHQTGHRERAPRVSLPSGQGCWNCPGTRPMGRIRTSSRSSTRRSRGRCSGRRPC